MIKTTYFLDFSSSYLARNSIGVLEDSAIFLFAWLAETCKNTIKLKLCFLKKQETPHIGPDKDSFAPKNAIIFLLIKFETVLLSTHNMCLR